MIAFKLISSRSINYRNPRQLYSPWQYLFQNLYHGIICGPKMLTRMQFSARWWHIYEPFCADPVACSMWWCVLRRWKPGIYCKRLAYSIGPSLSTGVLPGQRLHELRSITPCHSQHGSSGRDLFFHPELELWVLLCHSLSWVFTSVSQMNHMSHSSSAQSCPIQVCS